MDDPSWGSGVDRATVQTFLWRRGWVAGNSCCASQPGTTTAITMVVSMVLAAIEFGLDQQRIGWLKEAKHSLLQCDSRHNARHHLAAISARRENFLVEAAQVNGGVSRFRIVRHPSIVILAELVIILLLP